MLGSGIIKRIVEEQEVKHFKELSMMREQHWNRDINKVFLRHNCECFYLYIFPLPNILPTRNGNLPFSSIFPMTSICLYVADSKILKE